MIEIIGIAIGMLLLSGICFFIADRFLEKVFISVPMVFLGAICIGIIIVFTAVIVTHYTDTLVLNVGN